MNVEVVKGPLRAIRSWPPLNLPLTTGCRAGLRLLGRKPGVLARFLPRTGLVEVPLPNGNLLRMWSLADDDVTGHVYWKGWAGHEPEASPLFYDLAHSARATVDIGAHVGYFALLAARANRAASVYAFEPHPLVYQRLSRNAQLNELENMHCVPLAVGSERGTARFFHVRDGIHSSSSLSQDFMESIVDVPLLSSSEVNVVSLDEFVDERNISCVDLVKIDTETTEDAVFRGMTRTLERDHPVIFCEILQEPSARLIEEILRRFGYRFFLLTDAGPVLRDRVLPEPPWRNFCFAPESGPDPRTRNWTAPASP
jgi:FkbM family methyltransferase